jgi:hypothetical protein
MRLDKALVPGSSPRRPGSRAELTPAPPLPVQAGGHGKGPCAFPPVGHGPRQFLREKRQGLAWAMFLFQAGQILLTCFMVAQQQDGRFGTGPLPGGGTDFRAGRSVALARGCLGTRDQAAIRHHILDAGEALESVECVAHDEGQDVAPAWARAQTVQGRSLRGLGRVPARPCQVCAALVLGVTEGQRDLEARGDRGLGEARGDAVALGFVRALRAELREVLWARGLVDRRPALRAFPPERQAPPPAGTGGPPLHRSDRGLRPPPSPEAGRHLVRIARVVCGLATMHRFPGEGMAHDDGHAFAGTAIRQPRPGKATLDGHDQRGAIGGNSLPERLWSGLHIVRGTRTAPSWLTRQTSRLRACTAIPQ